MSAFDRAARRAAQLAADLEPHTLLDPEECRRREREVEESRKRLASPRCIAPTGAITWHAGETCAAHERCDGLQDDCRTARGTVPEPTERLCGAPAVMERTIEGLVCPLCAEHAAELDREQAN